METQKNTMRSRSEWCCINQITPTLHKPCQQHDTNKSKQSTWMNTQASFNIPTKFSNGYSKAIEMIEADQKLNQGLLFQGYKYANAVIDKETGRALEYRHLIQDPKYKDVWSEAGCKESGWLFQGYGKKTDGTKIAEGTKTCHWIQKRLIPTKKKYYIHKLL